MSTAFSGGGRPILPSAGTVTRWPPPGSVPFTMASPRSAILPGDGNYRGNRNPGIMAKIMNAIADNEGPAPLAGRRARGNRR